MTFVAATVKRTGVTNIATSIDATISGDGTNPIDANDIVGGLSTKTVAFAANDTADQTVSWEVVGDSANEPDEGFKVTLSNPSSPGGTISTAVARGTIMNDDNTAPANIYGPTTTSDTGPQTVGSIMKYKMSGVFGGTAWKIYFGATENDGSPGHVIEPANSSNYRMAPIGADGVQGTDNNWSYCPGGSVAGTAYEIIHDRTANTLSVKIGDQTPLVRGISNVAGGGIFRGVLGGSTGTMTVTAVS